MSIDTVTITFPDLSPAEASILAQELEVALAEDGIPAASISRQRAKADAQGMGSVLIIAGAAYLWELAQEAGKSFVKGAATRAGERAMDMILRKWGTRARVETPKKPPGTLGEQYRRTSTPRTIEQAQTLADLKSLAVIFLGASTFPKYPAERKLDNPAFKRSAELARQLFSPEYMVFRDVLPIDLFDHDVRPEDIVDSIEALVKQHPQIRDVIIYYCGHGDFLRDRDRTYYLTLKGTRPGLEAATGLKVKDFRLMTEQHLGSKRCTFILDCCFAGAAVEAFMLQTLEPLIEAQMRDLPRRGFALLTAADRDLVAVGNDGKGATMFTGALAEALSSGSGHSDREVSLRELCDEIEWRIRDRHGQHGVLPQCHAPKQIDGDVSRVPMFIIGTKAPIIAAKSPLVSGPAMVVVPPGEFMMGSPPDEKHRRENEGPQHKIRIARPFDVGKFQITVGEWKVFMTSSAHDMGDGAYAWNGKEWVYTKGAGWGSPGFVQDDQHPVTCVNWHDAQAYAAWLSNATGKTYRLLSEAEWEYACRAGSNKPFNTGETISTAQANCDDNYTYGPVPVGSYPGNDFGLHDMHGNVWEWCQDAWSESYNPTGVRETERPDDGSPWLTGDVSCRVVRGGGWGLDPWRVRSAVRGRVNASYRYHSIGFRVAGTL